MKRESKQHKTAFKEQAAKHAHAAGIGVAAHEHGPVERTLRNRVNAALAVKLVDADVIESALKC